MVNLAKLLLLRADRVSFLSLSAISLTEFTVITTESSKSIDLLRKIMDRLKFE